MTVSVTVCHHFCFSVTGGRTSLPPKRKPVQIKRLVNMTKYDMRPTQTLEPYWCLKWLHARNFGKVVKKEQELTGLLGKHLFPQFFQCYVCVRTACHMPDFANGCQ